MIIERIEVEEGFLDGLDLFLEPGLNVLVGPRGSGKTSVIELIRFCLDVRGFTSETQKRSRQHALSVLGPGQVTLTLSVDGEKVTVARSAEDRQPRYSSGSLFPRPMILSQGEIERVALDAQGRLRIIDQFRREHESLSAQENRLLAQIASVTTEIGDLASEIRSLDERLISLASVPKELEAAQAEEAKLASSAEKLGPQRKRLEELDQTSAMSAVRRDLYEQWISALDGWKRELLDARAHQPLLQRWPTEAGPNDPTGPIRERSERVLSFLSEAVSEVERALAELSELSEANRNVEVETDKEARHLRRQLDQLQEGAGAVAQRLAKLREAVSQLQSLSAFQKEQNSKLIQLQKQRTNLLEELDLLREKRFSDRRAIAEALNSELGPRIDIKLLRYGLHTDYESRIASALRGSQLHYNVLAPVLASGLSPRELIEAVESGDAEAIVAVCDIAIDRAQRVTSHLQTQDVGEILTSPLEDSVSLRLLDGDEYKDTEHVSTGQRCTVILPILLGHRGQSLIIDQPEDHLDNAFIVETVIRAILKRGDDSQLIFATHNANIPVLGNAARVAFLEADGNRGFVAHAGELMDSKTVQGISDVMEGGHEAFLRRATFYEELIVDE